MLFSEIEKDTFNQAELNEIKINDDHEIFEVLGQMEIPRRRTNIWGRGVSEQMFS
jgi:hypothetical protein